MKNFSNYCVGDFIDLNHGCYENCFQTPFPHTNYGCCPQKNCSCKQPIPYPPTPYPPAPCQPPIPCQPFFNGCYQNCSPIIYFAGGILLSRFLNKN